MKWIGNDLKQYQEAKEYIDTLIFPLVPITFSDDAQLFELAIRNELIMILTNELEKELHGRLLLAPTYYYLSTKENDFQQEFSRINDWVKDSKNQPFQHVFFITNDATWKMYEKELQGILLWIPSIKTDDISDEKVNQYIRGQVEQLSELLQMYWSQ